MKKRILPLKGSVHNDDWGKSLNDSLVAQFSGSNDASQRYSELWFGSHPSAPSLTCMDGKVISTYDLLQTSAQEVLGAELCKRYGNKLPFLFKVLSIGTPLSIQAHPAKAHAEQLHRVRPEQYPDDNHKPEVAVALTPVELLYGFLPPELFRRRVRQVPEFERLVDRKVLEGLFTEDHGRIPFNFLSELLGADASVIRSASTELLKRIQDQGLDDSASRWVSSLRFIYPDGDIGFFLFFLMNLERLEPGEAVFIGPNVPHAYLSGDLVECMANSDNVVRAGLTPKYKDVETLLEMSNQADHHFARLLASPQDQSSFLNYSLPSKEFTLDILQGSHVASEETSFGPNIILCKSGCALLSYGDEVLELSEGEAALVFSDTRYRLDLRDGTLFRARVP